MKKLATLKSELGKMKLGKEDQTLEENLQKILNRFYEKMSRDTMLGFFFQGKDLGHIVKQQQKLLLMVMGITSSYDGKPVNQAHAALPPILPGHFDRRMVLLEETLHEFNFPKSAMKDWVDFEQQFRNVIVK